MKSHSVKGAISRVNSKMIPCYLVPRHLASLLRWLCLFQVRKKERSDDIVVHHLCPLELGVVKPKEETALDVEIEGNKCSQNRCSRLNNGE